ncbi:MAG TPA: M1 family aminopeptidase [Holophagaceae bacterium]|nr:M1 family aminopeptidase [Holophagaceae bacterium]
MKCLPVLMLLGTALFGGGPGQTVHILEAKDLRLEPAHELKTMDLKAGHAVFTLQNGRAARAFDGSRCVGFYFEGSGGIDYVSATPTEQPVIRYDLTHGTKVAPGSGPDGVHISTNFLRAFFWIAGPTQAPFTGSESGSLETAFRAHAERFSHAQVSQPGLECLNEAMNDPTHPWMRAELDGGQESWIYEWDQSQSRMENLDLLKQFPSSIPGTEKDLDPITISTQPIGWDLHKPEPGAYFLTSVDVDLREDAPSHGVLKVQETVRAVQDHLRLLRFNLQDRVLGQDRKLHQVVVKRVLDTEGHDMAFAQTLGEVSVELSQEVPAGGAVNLQFEIEGDFLVHPGGDSYWQLGTGAWFPQPDLNGQMMTWHATVRVRKPWIAFSGGDTVRRWQDGDYNAVETRSEFPIAFPVILGGDYLVERETRGGLTVEVATYSSKAQFSKSLIDIAFWVLKYYQSWMGPYPYKEFHIIEKNQWGYGQAPASVMFITKEAFNQTMPDKSMGTFVGRIAEDVRHRFVHEIAHQWWGTLVKMPSFEEQWITESFAEASAGMCLGDWPNSRGKSEFVKLKAQWKSRASEASPRATIPTGNRIFNPDDSREAFLTRVGLIYDKGAWLLHCIHQELGDDRFLVFMRSLQTNFKGKFLSTQQVEAFLEFMTKKDWKPFFEQNYWGTGFPMPKE